MNVFVDTATLFKKYANEIGSDRLEEILLTVDNIIVAPITRIELNKAIQNRIKAKLTTLAEARKIKKEILVDYNHLQVIEWDRELENHAIDCVVLHNLKSLDAIQLAAGIISGADQFITSDRFLYNIAKKIVKNAIFV